jgi:CopG-like RHH_1 or ribbon-helix-helix domain, RHH_5
LLGRFAVLTVSNHMTQIRPTHTHRSNGAPRQASRRIKVTLPAAVAQQLDRLALRAGEPPAKVAAHMIRQAITDAERDEPDRGRKAREHTPSEHADQDSRPPWLEPYGGSREWRGLMWGAIVGLHARYPEALSSLKEGWWQNDSHLETLSALAISRQWIDDAGHDPREELAFQAQLADYSHVLRQERGSTLDEWQPGAPPIEWS